MSFPASKSARWWRQVVTGFAGTKNWRRRPTRRQLAAEFLERRTVLSVAPTTGDASTGLTLDEYLAQEHMLGPVDPGAAVTGDTPNALEPTTPAEPPSPAATDQILANFDLPEGEGEEGDGGEGGGEGGEGGGEGEEGDGGSGSGGGEEAPSENPVITEPEISEDGTTVSGTISDDGGLGDLTPILSGPGTLTIDENGGFTIDLTGVQDHGAGTLTITDADGNSTTIVYSF